MQPLRFLKSKIRNEVQCALCLGTVCKKSATSLHGRHVCGWCERYYSTKFPSDWKEKARMDMLL